MGAGKGIKDRLTAEVLRALYVDAGLSQIEIARRYDCTPQFISQLVKEYGLGRHTPSKT